MERGPEKSIMMYTLNPATAIDFCDSNIDGILASSDSGSENFCICLEASHTAPDLEVLDPTTVVLADLCKQVSSGSQTSKEQKEKRIRGAKQITGQ